MLNFHHRSLAWVRILGIWPKKSFGKMPRKHCRKTLHPKSLKKDAATLQGAGITSLLKDPLKTVLDRLLKKSSRVRYRLGTEAPKSSSKRKALLLLRLLFQGFRFLGFRV